MTTIDLTAFPADRSEPHGALIICPGGGYARHAPLTTEPIAEWLNSIGISAFVLRYSLAPERHPAPLTELQTAIRTVRSSAAKYNLDPTRVGVIGFSAGGHLASTVSTRFDFGSASSADPIHTISSRPDVVLLGYPVISFDEYSHAGKVNSLLGNEPDEQLREGLSNHKQVTAQTPPTFIWHTADDPTVSVQNSLLYASALSTNDVPFELHVFPHGPHGTGLASDYPVLNQWTGLAQVWLNNQGF